MTATTEWMDVVRPALRTKMRKYGGGGDDGGHDIRFSLLAIVDDAYEKASDEWEYWRSERRQLERRLEEGWQKAVSWCSCLYLRLQLNIMNRSIRHFFLLLKTCLTVEAGKNLLLISPVNATTGTGIY